MPSGSADEAGEQPAAEHDLQARRDVLAERAAEIGPRPAGAPTPPTPPAGGGRKSGEIGPSGRVAYHHGANIAPSEASAIASHCARPGSRRQNGQRARRRPGPSRELPAQVRVVVTVSRRWAGMNERAVGGDGGRTCVSPSAGDRPGRSCGSSSNVDPLERTGAELELVGVGIGDARQRIAADVERRPRDEPLRGALDRAAADARGRRRAVDAAGEVSPRVNANSSVRPPPSPPAAALSTRYGVPSQLYSKTAVRLSQEREAAAQVAERDDHAARRRAGVGRSWATMRNDRSTISGAAPLGIRPCRDRAPGGCAAAASRGSGI